MKGQPMPRITPDFDGQTVTLNAWHQDQVVEKPDDARVLLRSEFTRTLPVESLAAVAGMSTSSFHQHFRNQTSLTPLQFQKQLRLIEARRLMLGEGATASSAAFAVGYESVPQFTREYGRMFGMPPAKDAESVRKRVMGED